MYKVIERFKDLRDNGHVYNVGDVFPRDGVTVSKKRIKELESGKNRRGISLIKEVRDDDADRGVPGTEELVRQRFAED